MPMRGAEFGGLTAFVAVADHGNFSKAAAALGISASTMSQTISTLEKRLGVRLLNRTTRSVALTEAGDQLLRQIHPALDELGNAIESLAAHSDTPSGVLRLAVGSLAVKMVIDPILSNFRAAYPDIVLDITIDDSQLDIVNGHFDAGMRIGSRIERDMVAVRVTPDSRLIAVASPAYLAAHGQPSRPEDLREHDCIRFRDTTGAIRKWEFARGAEKIDVAVEGALITNDLDHLVRAALNGVGISYMLEDYMQPHIAAGRLVAVLEGWSLPFTGFHLFYPSRDQMPPKLRAFISFLRAGSRRKAMRPHLALESDAA
jgi:DNA-binding transcriptional LysR family regulator